MPNYFPMLCDLILQMARSTPENTYYCVVLRIGFTHWKASIPRFLITCKSRGIVFYMMRMAKPTLKIRKKLDFNHMLGEKNY